MLGSKVGTTCDCWLCLAEADPPAPEPPTEQAVRELAEAEGLTLVPGRGGNKYKYVHGAHCSRFPFVIRLPEDGELPPWPENHPARFATAHEAALELARHLGAAGSAALAEEEEPLTEEKYEACMKCTGNGRAFGGLYGGFECERCFFDESAREPCGVLYRSFGHASEGGRACATPGGWGVYGPRQLELTWQTEPVAQVAQGRAKRGFGGRVFFSEEEDEGGSSSEGGKGGYTHHCLFKGCSHKVRVRVKLRVS